MEASATLGAEEGFLAGVDALMDLYVALIDELLATVGTRVGLLLDVRFHVFFQLFRFAELKATAAAEEKTRWTELHCERFGSSLCMCSNMMGLKSRLTVTVFPTLHATEGRPDPGLPRQ